MLSTVEALERYLASLPEDLAESPLAASAWAMAGIVDGGSSATSRTMAQARLADALKQLRELEPPAEQERTRLDDIAARSVLRLAGGTATEN